MLTCTNTKIRTCLHTHIHTYAYMLTHKSCIFKQHYLVALCPPVPYSLFNHLGQNKVLELDSQIDNTFAHSSGG